MILRFIVALLSLGSLAACTDRYTLDGRIEGAEGWVWLLDDKAAVIDSTLTDAGRFTFRGSAPFPTAAYLSVGEKMRPLTMLFLEPGAIRVEGSTAPRSTYPSGTAANDAYRAYRTAFNARIGTHHDPEATERDQLAADSLHEAAMREAESIRDNMMGLWMIGEQASRPSAWLIGHLDSLTPKMQRHPLAVRLRAVAAHRALTEEGRPFLEIEEPDTTGRTVALSTLVGTGRYVLVEFWASWCGPCMAGMPALRRAYDAYHDRGFDVYAVSLDTDREAWCRTIREKEMPWTNVSLLSRFDTRAVKDYAVEGIPTNLLIGPDGVIIARDIPTPRLASRLAALIGTEPEP